MQQILRLARRDGDEWVRLFAAVLTPFPQSQTVAVDACMEGSMEGVQEEIGEACKSWDSHVIGIWSCDHHLIVTYMRLFQKIYGSTISGRSCDSCVIVM